MGEPPVDPMEETSAGPSTARPSGLVAGAQIGGYTLRAVIGEGGMGVVWSAHDPDLDRTLAIKLLRHDDAAPSLRRRLLREARAMARLKHANVLTVYEVGTEGDRDYIAMELVDGGNLDAWLATQPPREEVMAALLAAGRGLAAAHGAGLVHRDFKPLNVLRSRDGRVLITDFGLARGLGDDAAAGPIDEPLTAPVTTTSRPTDSVLDSPMTEAGQLIGTPAYMAPEQYVGGLPEPRTDQFAYCVSVWQALTGERPFKGRSLEELRRAACSGVAEIECDLPADVRAVLARGLDPDPAQRWPDMDHLLGELVRVTRPRARKRWWLGAAALAFVAIALVFALTRGRTKAVGAAVTCEPAAQAFASAWSQALRRDAPERIADALDGYAKRWTAAYDHACGEHAASQIDCLLGLRDRAAAFARALPLTGGELDAEAVLAPPAVCTTSSPPSTPAVPPEAVPALARALALRVAWVEQIEGAPAKWPPLAGYLGAGLGMLHVRTHELARARPALAKGLEAATAAHDARLEAEIRLAQYDLAVLELEHPEQATQELTRLRTYARAAVRAAGEDAELVARLAFVEARTQRGKEALGLAAQAKRRFQEAGDARHAAIAGSYEAWLQLARGDDAGLDEAQFAARAADELLERARLPNEPAVDVVRGEIDLVRGATAEAHERFDRAYRTARPVPARWPEHRGRVIDAAGAPVGGARVVAWASALLGDRERAYTDPKRVLGEFVETAADGTFAIHVPPGAAIVAEHGDARSAPQQVGGAGSKLQLALAPTTTITGTMTGRVAGLLAFAQVTAGPASWLVRAPVDKDGGFKIERVPRGAVVTGLLGLCGDGRRRVLAAPGKLRWATGERRVEIVSRTARDGATVLLFREATPAPRTRGEADAAVARASDVAIAALEPIGGRATEAGTEHYRPGARHAILAGLPDGQVTACVASDATTAARVTCKSFAVARPDSGDVQAVLVDGPE